MEAITTLKLFCEMLPDLDSLDEEFCSCDSPVIMLQYKPYSQYDEWVCKTCNKEHKEL